MTGTKATSARPPWTAGAAWIQGRYRPIEEAKVSVLDLGLTRSDCTYDVVHVWRGRFYRLDAHLDRFSASLARLRLDPGYGRAEIEAILHGCVRQAGLREAYVSMTCTRGRMAAGSRDLRTARNTFYCFAVPFIWISSPDRQAAGASLWVSQVVRIPPQSVDPSVKNYHWLDLDLALLDAYDHDADLVVLRDLTGAITEGPGYNVFAHVDGRWLTPGRGTLRGITRQTVIELLRQAGQPVEEGQLSDDELRRAAEVLVTSTAGGIMPVTLIDGTPVGTGEPGPQTRQLRDLYWASHEDERYSTPVRYDEPDGQGTAATQSDHGGASWQRLLLAGLMSRAQRLTVVLGLNLALVAGLVVVGVGAHSVGVLAEGGDYLLDVAGAGLALLAIRLSTRRAGGGRPARYLRTTGFAALVNSGWLLVLELLVAGLAVDRLATRTPEVHGLPVLVASGIAALAMTVAAFVLRGDDPEGEERDLSVTAVLLDTVADAAAAAGVAVAGAIILAVRGWYWLDPAVALAIAVLVAYHATKLMRKVLSRGRAPATRPVLRCDQRGDDVADLIGSQRAGGVADGQFHPPPRQEVMRARFPGSRRSWPAAAQRRAGRPGSRPGRPGRRR